MAKTTTPVAEDTTPITGSPDVVSDSGYDNEDKWTDKKLTRRPAWGRMGIALNHKDKVTAVAAGQANGLDFEVETAPVVIKYNGRQLETDRVAIIRPEYQGEPEVVIGYASPKFVPLQNKELFEMLDPISKEWPVDTLGVLPAGDGIFMALFAGSGEIVPGENIEDYFLVKSVQNGGSALQIMYTGFRTRCSNALPVATRSAAVKARIVHTAGVQVRTANAVKLLADMKLARERMRKMYTQLAMTHIIESQVDDIIKAAFPDPKLGNNARLIEGLDEDILAAAPAGIIDSGTHDVARYDYAMSRILEFRSTTKGLYNRITDEYPEIAGTAWAAFNAVTESADYRRGNSIESVSMSTLFGSRAAEKTRAFTRAMSMV